MTLWAVLVVLLIWAGAAVAVVEVDAVQVRHRAAAAADAAALAAAGEGGLDPPAACRAARLAAHRVGADLLRCTLTGPYALVSVVVSPPRLARMGGKGQRPRPGRAGAHRKTGTNHHKSGLVVT